VTQEIVNEPRKKRKTNAEVIGKASEEQLPFFNLRASAATTPERRR
jgi:hypothetical protein